MLRFSRCFTVGLLGASALVVSPRFARAEQFILLDATFDYTWEDATNSSPSKSHFYVNEGNFLNKQRPKNWVSPQDYRNGTLHVRTEVFKKPAGDQQVGWTLCYIPYSGGYGCADTTYYKSTGVFDRETKMTDWWNNDQLNWDQGVKQVDMIYAINDSGSGHITNYPDLKDLTTPTRVRITMVQVSAGSTYDPSIIPGIGGGGDTGGSGAGGNAASAGAGGMTMLPMGGAGGAPSGGMGGLLDMTSGSGGMPAGNGSSAGTTSIAGTTSTAGTTPVTPTGAAGSGSVNGAPAGTADTSNDAGCSMTSAPQDIAGLSGALAALSALALARRTRRLLRR